MISTISNMRHYIRTAYGDSDFSYGSDGKILQGSIQGNAAASPMFVAISCVLLNFLESFVQGFHIQTAITLTILTIAAIMYVDDTDLLVSSKSYSESLFFLISRLQKSVKIWRKGVIQTGGALRPEKCKWFLVSFKWSQGKWKYGSIADDLARLYLRNSNGVKIEIERLEVHHGLTGLGVCIAPDGNQMDQVNTFMNTKPGQEGKIIQWINNIRSKYLRPHDVYLSAFRSIFKSIEYVLPATSMSESETKLIETKLYKVMLPKMGVARNISLPYRYSPKRYQGLGCLEIRIQQYCEKVQIFLYHANTNTQLGLSIKANLESLHLLIGVNTPIFQLPFQHYGFLGEKTWITHLWEMNDKLGFTLQGLYSRPHITRANDFSLMEKLVSSNIMTAKEIQSVNRCRVFLKVLNLSDITNGKGTAFTRQFFEPPYTPTNSKYRWPNQPKPTPTDWKEWKRALLEIWNTNEQGILQHNLGQIICETHVQSNWSFSHSMRKLYRNFAANSNIAYTSEQHISRRDPTYTPDHHCNALPDDCVSVLVNNSNPHKVTIESTLPHNQINFREDSHGNNEFYRYVKHDGNLHQIVQDIRHGIAIAASDGSVKNDIGSASWIITGDAGSISTYQGSHGVPPTIAPMTSHRAELYGIYAILQSLLHLEQQHDIRNGKIKIVCNNRAALHCSFNFNHRAPVSCRNFDIIWGIQRIREQLHTTIFFKHVYGHTDKLKRPLTWPEQLNCKMDKHAKRFRLHIKSSPHYEYSTLHLQHDWTLLLNGIIVGQDISTTVKNHHYFHRMSTHLIENKGCDINAPKLINWTAIEKATNALPLSRQIWATKFVSGFCGVAEKMQERGQWESNMCPLCHMTSENAMHVVTCTDCRALTAYHQLTLRLQSWLDSTLTHPEIVISILSTLAPSNHKSFFYNLPPQSSTLCVQAAKQQDLIGRDNFFKGHISQMWMHAQKSHLRSIGDPHPTSNSASWATNLVTQMYQFSYGMWENRNEIVHTKVEERLNQIESEALTKQIEKAYMINLESMIRFCDRTFFQEGIQHTLQRSVRDKKAWLATIKASQSYVEKSNDNMYDHMRRNMRTWLS